MTCEGGVRNSYCAPLRTLECAPLRNPLAKNGNKIPVITLTECAPLRTLLPVNGRVAMKNVPTEKHKGVWVQTERESHEAWAALTRKSPLAAQIMHLLAARVGEHNAVVISQGTLAQIAGASRRGVQNALSLLNKERWLEVRQIGERSTVNAYVVNDRVVWATARDGLRYSLFSANVVLTDTEQPDRDTLSQQAALRSLPRINEIQIPHGDGLPPPSQPALRGLEPDLPATNGPEETQLDIEEYITRAKK